MRTLRRICAIAILTSALATLASAEEGWIGTGHKLPQTASASMMSQETPDSNIAKTGEASSYFDELYGGALLFLQMNLF